MTSQEVIDLLCEMQKNCIKPTATYPKRLLKYEALEIAILSMKGEMKMCDCEGRVMINYGRDHQALDLVIDYIERHLDKSDSDPKYEVYIVWKTKALQNCKYLISSSLNDGMYYEVTYNGDKDEWYLDAYKKFENICIKSDK